MTAQNNTPELTIALTKLNEAVRNGISSDREYDFSGKGIIGSILDRFDYAARSKAQKADEIRQELTALIQDGTPASEVILTTMDRKVDFLNDLETAQAELETMFTEALSFYKTTFGEAWKRRASSPTPRATQTAEERMAAVKARLNK